MRLEVETHLEDALRALDLPTAAGQRCAVAAMRGMNKYSPMDTGMLRDTAEALPWEVHYVQGYASYVYEGDGMNISKFPNPFARSHWPEFWDGQGAPELADEYKRCMVDYSGGIVEL